MTKITRRENINPKVGEHKYGNVTYADPTNKKYPIDTEEHIRAAWSYINHADNAAKYKPGEVAAIKKRIEAAAKKHGIDIQAKSFLVSKQANGRYRWTGSPSNNAFDREDEAAAKTALEEVVTRSKAEGHYPPLQFFHIDYDLGTTDYYTVVDGILVASGEFNSDPVSKAVAQYYVDHPEGLDGSGWAMSWRFFANADREGVYKNIRRIKEFTFLPFSRAANQLTEFSVEVSKMAWTEEQRKAMDAVLNDPALLAVVEQALAAQKKSEALDSAGVQRKSTDQAEKPVEKDVAYSTSTQYTHGPNGLNNEPGVTRKDADDGAGDDNDDAKAGVCANCGHSKAKHGTAKAAGEGNAACNVSGCECTSYKAKTKALAISDEDLAAISKFVNEAVEAKVDELTSAVNKALEPLAEVVKSLQQEQEQIKATEEAIQDRYETPKVLSTYERLKAFSPSANSGNVIDKDDPLAAGPAEDDSNSIFAQVGLK